MAVAWTNISNAQVAPGAALTTALMTALRDNPEGIAQRATGAPKIFGCPYDYQEFTSNGTWTRPANWASGDFAILHIVGGGNGGTATNGGVGGCGMWSRIPITVMGASQPVTIGAGGAGGGGAGGTSIFGTSGGATYFSASSGALLRYWDGGGVLNTNGRPGIINGGTAATAGGTDPGYSLYGGGGGGSNNASRDTPGFSGWAGRGGVNGGAGQVPGGGGGAGSNVGARGEVRVWCIREEA